MMRALGLVALCGCNQIFGLVPTKNPQDAPPDVDYCAVHQGSAISHDEDGDLIDDGCDACPGLADPDQADTLETANGGTADGVGDACDPSPTIGGDRLAKLAPFASPGELAAWTVATGSWGVASDTLVYVDPTGMASGSIFFTGATLRVPYAVEARLVIDAMPSALNTGTVAIRVGDLGGNGFACELDHDTTGNDIVFLYTDSGSDTNHLTTPIGVGSAYQLRVVWTASELSCRFDATDGQHAAMHAGTGTGATAGLQLTIDHFAGHFDYVAIYDLSGEP
ncbi:MAG: hypothetical protein ACM31C_20520 [Acidobacteriota bacterium]